MPHLLMLGAGAMQMPALRAAKDAGHRVTAIDPKVSAPGLQVADEAHVADLADEDSCLRIAQSCSPDGVMTLAADYPMPMVAKIAAALSLPGPTPQSIEAATDKAIMREALAKADVPVPAWRSVHTVHELSKAIADLGGDVVVKPARSSGGRGVTKLAWASSEREVRRAHEHARKISPDESVPLLVEQFVDGAEFSVEAITVNGTTRIVACTDKETTGPPHFVEVGHRQPTALDEPHRIQLEEVVRDGIAALGLRDTASHTEVRLGPLGPVVIEVASRCGGGYICSHLVPLSSGIDMVGAAISVALGLEPKLTVTRHSGAAVAFVRTDPGQVISILNVDRARNMPGVIELELSLDVGDQVPRLRDARDRIGYCICEGRDAREAAQRCTGALAELAINIKSTAA